MIRLPTSLRARIAPRRIASTPLIRVLLAEALLLASLACGRSNVYEGHGEVREVDRAQRQVVVAHDEIPGLMSAMTMSFDVPDAELLAQLGPASTSTSTSR